MSFKAPPPRLHLPPSRWPVPSGNLLAACVPACAVTAACMQSCVVTACMQSCVVTAACNHACPCHLFARAAPPRELPCPPPPTHTLPHKAPYDDPTWPCMAPRQCPGYLYGLVACPCQGQGAQHRASAHHHQATAQVLARGGAGSDQGWGRQQAGSGLGACGGGGRGEGREGSVWHSVMTRFPRRRERRADPHLVPMPPAGAAMLLARVGDVGSKAMHDVGLCATVGSGCVSSLLERLLPTLHYYRCAFCLLAMQGAGTATSQGTGLGGFGSLHDHTHGMRGLSAFFAPNTPLTGDPRAHAQGIAGQTHRRPSTAPPTLCRDPHTRRAEAREVPLPDTISPISPGPS